ncbi:MAG: hypothetical protein ACO1N0_13110 [Fluviicola sp.]
MKRVYLIFSLMLLSILLMFLFRRNSVYSADFTSLKFPPASTKSKDFVDSILKAEKPVNIFGKELKIVTDRKKYGIGEEVELTITNNTGKTEYFYPSDEESNRILELMKNSTYNDKAFEEAAKNSFISKANGIHGDILYDDPSFLSLSIWGENTLVASKYGIEGFDDPLKSGDKMVFHIKMPKRPGFYYFVVPRFSHDSKSIGYAGANRFIPSNVFEITR